MSAARFVVYYDDNSMLGKSERSDTRWKCVKEYPDAEKFLSRDDAQTAAELMGKEPYTIERQFKDKDGYDLVLGATRRSYGR